MTRIKLNSSQVAMAKALGISLEDYANELLKAGFGSAPIRREGDVVNYDEREGTAPHEVDVEFDNGD
jgi:hypothetical protein